MNLEILNVLTLILNLILILTLTLTLTLRSRERDLRKYLITLEMRVWPCGLDS